MAYRKGFYRVNFLRYGFFGWSTYQFSLVILHPTSFTVLNTHMDSKDKDDIRKLLTTIEQMTREADAQAKMEVLQMLGMTSQSVIAMAKKLTEPKVKTRVVTKYIEKPAKKKSKQVAKKPTPPTTSTNKPVVSTTPLKPVPPVKPLSNQRSNEAES
jgi:hypothetical protein